MTAKLTFTPFFEKHFLQLEERRSQKGFTWQQVVDDYALAVNPENLRTMYKNWRKVNLVNTPIQNTVVDNPYVTIQNFETTTTNKTPFQYINGQENLDKGTKEFTFSADNIPTEEEIISHFNIDTKKYKINQIWHKTSFGGKYSVTVSMLAKKAEEATDYVKAFTDFLEKKDINIKLRPKYSSDELTSGMLLISLADLHIGNYQVEDYLEKIYCTITSAVDQLNANLEEIVILNAGDLIHSDNSKGTTFSGTQLELSQSYEKSFTDALDFITEVLDYCQSKVPRVKYINIRGNHSIDSEYLLGEALRRIFKKEENVEIINNQEFRTYYQYGNSGFLFTHGHTAGDRLPLIFATEGREVFGQSENHYVFMGHYHHLSSKQFVTDKKEYGGIEVRVLSSPSSTDKWHNQSGFVESKKKIDCFIFTEDDGKLGEFNFRIK